MHADIVEVADDIVVPEPDNFISISVERRIPLHVPKRPGMLRSIDFNDQHRFRTKEIGDVACNGNLPTKF